MSNSWFQDQRLAAGLTVTALARQISAPLQTVSRWEHGYRPPWRWIPKLADIFRVRSEEIVERLRGERVGDPCPRPHDC
jgi:DNA-binding XRE family transcriptional regulator